MTRMNVQRMAASFSSRVSRQHVKIKYSVFIAKAVHQNSPNSSEHFTHFPATLIAALAVKEHFYSQHRSVPAVKVSLLVQA